MFTINVIITIIDEFQQLNLFVFELLFYVIGDMSVKSIIKFVVFLASLLKKMYQLFKKCNIFIKFWAFYSGRWGLFLVGKFFICCRPLGLGLEPALHVAIQAFSYGHKFKQNHVNLVLYLSLSPSILYSIYFRSLIWYQSHVIVAIQSLCYPAQCYLKDQLV